MTSYISESDPPEMRRRAAARADATVVPWAYADKIEQAYAASVIDKETRTLLLYAVKTGIVRALVSSEYAELSKTMEPRLLWRVSEGLDRVLEFHLQQKPEGPPSGASRDAVHDYMGEIDTALDKMLKEINMDKP